MEIVTGVRGWEISINVYFNDDSLFPVWVGLNQMPKYPLSRNLDLIAVVLNLKYECQSITS